MSNNNPSGVNGYGQKNYPSDDVLSAALHQYAKEQLIVEDCLRRLSVEHGLGLIIKKSKLAQLNKKFNVPNVRNHKPPPDVATQAILEKVAQDTSQSNGVGTLKTLLANNRISLPRQVDLICSVLRDFAPEGLSRRFPGANCIRRSALVAIGPNHQHHADGHEKLNAQGLKMGGVGLNIYGIKDQWSSYLLHLVVVSNNRLETTIGQVYLDCVEKHKFIPITFVYPQGLLMTGVLYAFQNGLCEAYAADISQESPLVLQMKSIHNTPIKGLWHWFLQTFGFNIKEEIQSGYADGIYKPNNPLHKELFNWLWPQILQIQLDCFVQFWNNYRIRVQKDKPNMSGSTPYNGFVAPQYPAQDCKIMVDQPVIDALRGQIAVTRHEAMRWVDEDFAEEALTAFESIGSPDFRNVQTG
ncbi:hypothetical protein CPB83DRAFT_775298 [Crepidotus variabilis]|uniref:Uncharacterized protein n=1 Tax=Crepidotus variabilis TaxID=179855 RepID=A0A9P6E6S4_9AGAR|nr:hypothetical protein CPB83DRAFT_775298 [Crepidotus variabilis]